MSKCAGEMIVGPNRALFMDEITNGLDSSTAFQVIACLQQLAHITDATVLVSILQPAPETFDLFDDVILMTEGKIVYHGPRDHALKFFEDCGFKCPERKGVADFLQEVSQPCRVPVCSSTMLGLVLMKRILCCLSCRLSLERTSHSTGIVLISRIVTYQLTVL